MDDIPKTIEYFIEIEQTAAEILEQKEQILNLHKRLNETREALSEITKSNVDKAYMYQGSLLVKRTKEDITSNLKSNFKQLNEEIRIKGDRMKQLVYKLQDIEKKQPYSGKNLIPLDRNELSALSQVWGKNN